MPSHRSCADSSSNNARRLLPRLRAFVSLPFGRKVAFFEAAVALAAAQLLVTFVPYSRWAGLLGPIVRASAPVPCFGDRTRALEVVWAIDAAARHLPWNAVCLPRAMAAKWMLARRKLPSTLHLGVRRRDHRSADAAVLHAWLSFGGETLIGGEVAEQFSAVAHYGPC